MNFQSLIDAHTSSLHKSVTKTQKSNFRKSVTKQEQSASSFPAIEMRRESQIESAIIPNSGAIGIGAGRADEMISVRLH
jgi:hypothetical protein